MRSPDLLKGFVHYRSRPLGCGSVLLLLLAGMAYTGLFVLSPMTAVVLGLCVLVFFFAFNLRWGLYIMTLFAFFHGWEIDFARYEWARDLPSLASLNAPLVDFIAVLLLLSFCVAWALKLTHMQGKTWKERLPGLVPYGLFIVSALASAFFIYSGDRMGGLWSWIRPVVFVYVMFVFLPYHIIEKKRTLHRIMTLWFGLGLVIAFYGLSSLFVDTTTSWWRAVPYAFGSFAPLGVNHNLLAEPLVAIIPLGLWLFLQKVYAPQWRLVFGYGTLFMLVIALLTLSRAAWLALVLEAVVLTWINRKEFFYWLRRVGSAFSVGALIVLVPIALYMAVFLGSSVVDSSNFSRVESTELAINLFTQRPVFGHGPGTFVELSEQTDVFVLEFGEALDAHGFIQKLIVEFGILGLVFFAGFLLWIMCNLYRVRKHSIEYQIFLAMVIGVVVFQLFNTSYFNSVMWLPIGMAATVLRLKS